MAETLGSLCDKLTIVKLKQWHAEDPKARENLLRQEKQLQEELEEYVAAAVSGQIPPDRLTFAANKVYKKEGNVVADISGTVGHVFSQLADVNCRLWHVQERVYDFELVPADKKDGIIKELAVLNLERTRCVDRIDSLFKESVESFRQRQ
jgi:hypothetical protein